MDALTHKCPNCGGPLTFDPKDQKFHCDYCLNIYTEAEVSQYEEEQKAARDINGTQDQPVAKDEFTFLQQKNSSIKWMKQNVKHLPMLVE